jgi:hypothetical protein
MRPSTSRRRDSGSGVRVAGSGSDDSAAKTWAGLLIVEAIGVIAIGSGVAPPIIALLGLAGIGVITGRTRSWPSSSRQQKDCGCCGHPTFGPHCSTPGGRWVVAADSARGDVHVLNCYVDQRGGHVQLVNMGDTDAHALVQVESDHHLRGRDELPSESPLLEFREQTSVGVDLAAGQRTTLDVGVLPFAEGCDASVTNLQALDTSPLLRVPTPPTPTEADRPDRR